MKSNLHLIVLFLSIINFSAFAQDTNAVKYTASSKGKFFVSWGGNRDSFSKSDIHFEGDNYNFTIKDATARDKPKGWHLDYINPTRMTIPQTNFKMGYFISDKYSISLGLDHMKYVMENEKTRTLSGYIDLPTTEEGSKFNGIYNNEATFLPEDFLGFEHTDGLNYIYTEIARHDDISALFNLPNTDKFQINLTEGIGGGFLLPKTNSTLLIKERNDEFHLSGYGVSARAGINFTFFKHFFMQLDLKGGYINMPNIRTTPDPADRASQHFTYLQRIVSFGGIFRI
ncbi:hypothetical protein [Algibacter lectus]|uniref:Outermembrane protein n=2 Tax=Algibacter lectus TaxID=221126 RepID=A0A4R8M390_9FLAO|nr:hypothetical protein [Algibacter lectus]MWW26617.1 hypothetical protein [Algibacter lectus]TDY59619.1 hypothetical protein DFQ06_3967 [Algibacter lectus]SFD61486.1 hypothetical protein SAMN04489722_11350 [Algibacter lectus]